MNPILLPAVAAVLILAPGSLWQLAAAQGARASSQVELAQKADSLKPGEWVWAPEVSRSGPVTIYVDLSRQVATIYRNGVRIGVSTVSTGKPGHETPTGVFQILQKDARHRSSKYNAAPMPYQERLTWDGVALHAGGLPGYPESHGCIHLPYEFARLLFATTQMHGTVVVAGRAGSTVRMTPAAGVLAPMDGKGADSVRMPLAEGEDWRWTPELSPEGPMSVVLSKSDQRAIVLRGGVEIGRARVSLPDQDFATHALTLTRDAQGRAQWIFTAVPGHAGEAGHALDAAVIERVRMPRPFHDAVLAAMKPGDTLLVTQAPIHTGSSGTKLAVLSDAMPVER
ncbi:L,D-transpeptidase family protein [Variovorax soli]|uniref:L,D-transpeptidase family protein n=1 Tax=Variovorax soli TaxID=376815 RepID=UPI000838AF2E|nr:L,D-transpeptidase family protein [Variovorax soli]